MAEQILTPETPAEGGGPVGPGPDQPFFGEEGEGLLGKQLQGRQRPGGNFEERALQQIRGTGPHVTRGGQVQKLIGTAGRMNQLMHGQQGPGATTGEAQRQQLLGARAAREDPYRDQLHYRKDFGTAMSDTVHGKATAQQAAFQKHIADTNKQLTEYSQQLAGDRTRVNQAYQTGQQQVETSYQQAVSGLPDKKSIGQVYDEWLRKENHPVWVMSGSNPDNPGEQQGTYRLHPDQLRPFFDTLVRDAGMTVIKNRIYVGGRGQEVHDQLRNTQQKNKVEYYEKTAPQIRDYNNQIDAAKSNLSTQRNQQLSILHKDYSDATAKIAAGEGAVQGRREGLQLEIKSNQNDLNEVRQSYQDRLGRIDETLNAMVSRDAGSRSTGEVRQITPRMVEQQQG